MRVLTIIAGTILALSLSAFTISKTQLFSKQKVIATITDDRLVEASGLEESYTNPGYFWTHNDSGGDPIVYLIDQAGKVQLQVELSGFRNRDWEEITTVKQGNKSYIYIAEIGDNRGVHNQVKIIRVEEPSQKSGSVKIPKENIEVMHFRYEEGARDAESMLYDQRANEFVLVTKREKEAMVYSFPFQPNAKPITITSKGTVPARLFTAADMNEAGEILLKHYGAIYYWGASAEPAVDRILAWKPTELDYTPEPQGEAICWYNGDFYTISEKNEGKPQEMLVFERK